MNPKEYYQEYAKRRSAVAASTVKPYSWSRASTETEIAVDWLKCRSGSILDIGCSMLALLTNVESTFENRNGIDIAIWPQWQQHPEIRTSVVDLNENALPYPDSSFDAITCLMVLEHVFDPYQLTSEIHRTLKTDGLAVIAVPNVAGIKRRFELLFGLLPITSNVISFSSAEAGWDGHHLHNFTKGSLGWLCRKQGLVPRKWKSQGRMQFMKTLWPSLFGNDLVVLLSKGTPDPGLAFTR